MKFNKNWANIIKQIGCGSLAPRNSQTIVKILKGSNYKIIIRLTVHDYLVFKLQRLPNNIKPAIKSVIFHCFYALSGQSCPQFQMFNFGPVRSLVIFNYSMNFFLWIQDYMISKSSIVGENFRKTLLIWLKIQFFTFQLIHLNFQKFQIFEWNNLKFFNFKGYNHDLKKKNVKKYFYF